MMDYNQPSATEIAAAEKIVERERSNLLNWRVHLLCTILLALAFVVNMMRGSSKNPSIINIAKCGTLDWGLFTGFILINIAVFYTQVVRVQNEE